MNIKH